MLKAWLIKNVKYTEKEKTETKYHLRVNVKLFYLLLQSIALKTVCIKPLQL